MRSRLAAGALAAAVAATTLRMAQHRFGGPGSRWERTNHAGRAVTLLEGPAHALGLAAGGALAGPAPVLAAVASGALGALDDLVGDGSSKGLKGHLRAAARGQVTTGLVKIVGLGATGLATAALADRRAGHETSAAPTGVPGRRSGPYRPSAVSTLVAGAGIAGTANLLNLFDLRPGRALKVGLLLATPSALAGSVPAAAAAGAALGVIVPDLRGEAMLGDTGANALGAVLGLALVEHRSTTTRAAILAAVTALTLASEKVSFTKVIEGTPVLRDLDAWGRPNR